MRSENRLVVSNTTPIITLSCVGQLSILQKLYGEVLIPPAVYAELLAGGTRVGVQELKNADYIVTTPLQNTIYADLLTNLDRGEAETIALALEKKADLLLLDERLGRRHATHLGLTITGSIGVLIKAKKQGYLATLKPALEQIKYSGIYLSNELIQRALLEVGE